VPSTTCSIFARLMNRGSGVSASQPYAPSTSLQATAARSAASGQKRLACAVGTVPAGVPRQPRGPRVEQPARLEICEHVGEREAHGVEVQQRPAERVPLAGIAEGEVERLGVQAARDRGDVAAGDLDRAERGPHARAGRSHHHTRCFVELHLADRQEGGRRRSVVHREADAGPGRLHCEQRDVGVPGLR
jgi:hypothetical protein